MARQDIYVDPIYGELHTTDNLTNKAILEMIFPEGITGSEKDAVCGEVNLPVGYGKRLQEKGVRVMIPYKPIRSSLQIRFSLGNNEGEPEYLLNPVNNKPWFMVYRKRAGELLPVLLPELYAINRKGVFHLVIIDNQLMIFSADETDMQIKASLKQNQAFLLKAMPGNIYQYPTTGVGLIEFLHGNFENSGLAARLQEEFENDKMVVQNAYMDSQTGELYLQVEERNG